ncbi:MAG: VOC family protein [Candidatus Eisenbacteria bacterium]|uniref:VOC family protein n=1 Tax=Eiseniibacteriota bacterium TaxID=2212470 RepID=A0A849SKV0_UNCEI|nr:VOC family protein [Candidatus Eisenbacteria bacterium]
MAKGIRKPGDFSWINMLTRHPDQAREFFGKLLGWTYIEIPGMGHRMQVDGHDIGGVFDLDGPNTPPGTPAYIGVMLKVENADATCARVTALGGRALPPFDIMDQGRMAVCFDPNGAEFDIWQALKGPGTDADSQHHGAPSWYENATHDVGVAKKFYTELFGWTPESMDMGGTPYTVFKLGGEYVAGLTPLSPQMGAVKPHWATTFTVRDVEAAAREAVALGGTVHVPIQPVPGMGRFCGITSPQRVAFYVIQYGG